MINAMQALPYCWTLCIIPMHFTTFELLLLATGIWTTSIHDTVDGKVTEILKVLYSRDRRSSMCPANWKHDGVVAGCTGAAAVGRRVPHVASYHIQTQLWV